MSVSWNALPYELRAETCITKFKKNLRPAIVEIQVVQYNKSYFS